MIDPSANSLSSGQSGRIQLHSQRQNSLFQNGVAVRVFVERAAAGGTVVLRAGGTLVRATTLFPLREGEWYIVRPERARGTVSLKVEQHLSRAVLAADITREAGLPPDQTALNLVRAFVRTGLPLDPRQLLRVYQRIAGTRRDRGEDTREKARLAAIMERKGLTSEAELIGALLGSGGETQERQRRRDGREQQSGEERLPLEELVKQSFALGDEAESPLQLFNHLVGEGDHWIIVPIRQFRGEGTASLRIRVPRAYALGRRDDTAAYREAFLVSEHQGKRVVFALQPTADGVRVTCLQEEGEAGAQVSFKELAERLAAAGATFARGTISKDSNDGFSSQDAPGIIASVDSSA